MVGRLTELALLFLKLGTIGFGGPAVHIATMEYEVVRKRQWLTRQHFLDLVGATNLIPGPNSTEMAIHIGYVRGGFMGLMVAGCCFILPAVLITTAFAWFYVEFGQSPRIEPILYGIKPAVLAVILSAGWRLGQKAITGWTTGLIVAGVTAIVLLKPLMALPKLPVPFEVQILVLAGGLGMLWLIWLRRDTARESRNGKKIGALLFAWLVARTNVARAAPVALLPALAAPVATTVSLSKLALFFLQVGMVLYGSGYVLIAYLEGGLVDEFGWLTREQLVEAIAIGQFTPGPILSTSSFVGYVVMAQEGGHAAGLAGAAVASLAIFLPSFVFVAILNPLVPKLRNSRWTAAFLDAVNAASMGLMAAVTLRLAQQVLVPSGDLRQVQWKAILIAAVAMVLVFRWNISAVWIVLGGAMAGGLLSLTTL